MCFKGAMGKQTQNKQNHGAFSSHSSSLKSRVEGDDFLVCFISATGYLGATIDTKNLASLLDSIRELVQHRLGVCPVDASVCDADAVFEA